MSRRRDDTLEAGSDSFLDIVANIVGILIILIVVAGLRVAHQPLHPDPTVTTVQPTISTFSIRDELKERWNALRSSAAAVAKSVAEFNHQQRAAELAADEERRLKEAEAESESLRNRIAELRTETAAAEQLLSPGNAEAERRMLELDQAEQQISQLLTSVQSLRSQVKQDEDRLQTQSTSLKQTGEQVALMRAAATQLATERTDLRATLVRARSRLQGEAPETLEHVVTPISRSVVADEFHFRVSGARVSFIPLDELIARLEDRVRSRSDIIVRQQRYDGSVGPVDGFRMHFTAEVVENTSLLSRHSIQEVRLSVSSWQVVPVDSSFEETVSQAADARSRFRSALSRIPAGATVTFWVYPDSFAAFRELREIARDRGARIAARPLPSGAPIAGSPRGSRSASQ